MTFTPTTVPNCGQKPVLENVNTGGKFGILLA